MKFLITGSNGLLGQKIIAQLIKREINFLATSSGNNRNPGCPEVKYKPLDITNADKVQTIISDFLPDVVINTAAMTNVDACEEDEDKCQKINVIGTRNLFEACKKMKIHFVHLSTDFVFDGENGPYSEEDKRNPLSIYAKSKVDSEDVLINDDYKKWSILRTIIVFGQGENLSRSNIVLWAIDALKKGDDLTIVNDQFRAPTWADDLAWACIQTGLQKQKGVFHIAGPETFSIYDLVCRIGKYFDYDISKIKPISSITLNQKAKRPPKTGFNLNKATAELGYKPMTIEESLRIIENEMS